MPASMSAGRAPLFIILQLLAPFLCSATTNQESHDAADGHSPQAPTALHRGPLVVRLERQSVLLPKAAARAGKRKNFYSAKVSVGKPAQEFHVAFDLGGGTMVLPAQSCTDTACLERRRYNKWISETAEDIQANGQLVQPRKRKTLLRRRDHGTLDCNSIDIGTGKVKGDFVRDQVCVRGEGDDAEDFESRCFPLAMLAVDKMSDMPFVSEPYDGIVGLGLKGMSVSAEFNFLAGFRQGYSNHGVFPNSFGLHIGGEEDGGEITFGGYDVKRLAHPLKWAAVADPQEGRWQVAVSAIRVGNKTLEACRDRACRAAMDYSASLLNVPTGLAVGLEAALAKLALPSGFGDGCQHLAIPDIHLELGSGVTLTLPAEDFVSDFGAQKSVTLKKSCQPLVAHNDADELLGKDVFILGESTLRRYYTFFNADSMQVGFSLAAGGKALPALPDGKDAGMKKETDENPVILLVQVKLLRSKTVSSLSL